MIENIVHIHENYLPFFLKNKSRLARRLSHLIGSGFTVKTSVSVDLVIEHVS
jgi:hypothetical protein